MKQIESDNVQVQPYAPPLSTESKFFANVS